LSLSRRTRAAFYETSEPWSGRYAEGYATERVIKVTRGPVIIPRSLAVLIKGLKKEEIQNRKRRWIE